MRTLERYHWPGNIRQLLNCIERGKIMAEDRTIRLRDLPREVCDAEQLNQSSTFTHIDDLASIERAKVVDVLRREEGNKTRAAKTLGIDRRKIYRLVEKYEITSDEVGATSRN